VSPLKRPKVRKALREARLFIVEAVLIVGLMLVYWLIRGAFPERTADAFARADQIIHFEQKLHFFWETGWQHRILGSRTLVRIANDIYLYLHLPGLIIAGIWIYAKSREHYRVYRNALLISACLGLIFYGLFPVAPPRMLPQAGFVDTVARFSANPDDLQPGLIINRYAAVPSFHFGWALLVGIALIDVSRNVWIRGLAVLFPVLMFFSIVVTANHFIFDAVVGGLVVIIAIMLAFQLENFPPLARQPAAESG
jgi:hypothetical protein